MNSRLFSQAIVVAVLTVTLAEDLTVREHGPANTNALSAEPPKDEDMPLKNPEIEDVRSGALETAGDDEQKIVRPNAAFTSPQKNESSSNVPIMHPEEHPPDEPTADAKNKEGSATSSKHDDYKEHQEKTDEPIEFLGDSTMSEKALPGEDQRSDAYNVDHGAHRNLQDATRADATSQEISTASDIEESIGDEASSTIKLENAASDGTAMTTSSTTHGTDAPEHHQSASEKGPQKESQDVPEGNSNDIQQEAGVTAGDHGVVPTEPIVSNNTDPKDHNAVTTTTLDDALSDAGSAAEVAATEQALSTPMATDIIVPTLTNTPAEIATPDLTSVASEATVHVSEATTEPTSFQEAAEPDTSFEDEPFTSATVESGDVMTTENTIQDSSDGNNEISDSHDHQKPGFDAIDSHSLTMLTFQKGENFACRLGPACPNDRSALQCQGALCARANITIVTCHNRNSEDIKPVQTERYAETNTSADATNRYALAIHWACGSDEPEFIVKSPRVVCEGYNQPGDRWLLSGSCSLRYGLDRLNSSALQSTTNSNHGFLAGTLFLITCFGIALLVLKAVAARQRSGNWMPTYCAMPLKARVNFRRKRQNEEEEPANVHFDRSDEQTALRDRHVHTYGNDA